MRKAPSNQLILLFDGECNLCNATVAFVLARDPQEQFLFSSLQSPAGQSLLAHHHLPRTDFETFVLLEGESVYTRSTAALRVAKRLHRGWSLFYALILVPRPIRDWGYRFVARNRYRWFGRRESCMLPSPALKHRFLEWVP